MRVAVLADIHANLQALQAVEQYLEAARPDRVIVAGDIINRGPRPRECYERIRELRLNRGWLVIKGNHEDYVLKAMAPGLILPEWERDVCGHTFWTGRMMEPYLDEIRTLPDDLEIDGPSGSRVHCVHASIKGNREGLYPSMDDDAFDEMTRTGASVLCVGHTHNPFTRYIGGRLVVNCGAVGMPFDRDPRASFALLEWTESGWRADIIRIPYDRDSTDAEYDSTGYIHDGGVMVPLIREELRRSRPLLSRWHREYEEAAASGRIRVKDSVNLLLETVISEGR